MKKFAKALKILDLSMNDVGQLDPIPFEEFLRVLVTRPGLVIRNVFQTFHDMVKNYVEEGEDEYPDDPESIQYTSYDSDKLFVSDTERPFFADRLFSNRFISHVETMRRGAQQNKIYVFEGPHGCGKSTFLNNLLKRFEEYANTENGLRFEVVWRISSKALGGFTQPEFEQLLEATAHASKSGRPPNALSASAAGPMAMTNDIVEVPCVSHDNPILLVPKDIRRQFFDELFKNDEFKWKLFTDKEYEWVFRDNPCTICSSLFSALLTKLRTPQRVFQTVYARPYLF
ncbi:MAG: serine protein kinase PrkA, partial [Deltaproteobacteria bacterium]|nr:serine protein kinase PrkA [Deltaproteobacteria bacterium]